MQEENPKCWDFVMSSFARSYGINRVMNEQRFHEVALQWCDDHNYNCDIYLDSLSKVDNYFRKYYTEWE